MGNVLDAKSRRLGTDSLNSIQTVKSHLSKKGTLIERIVERKDHLYDPIVPGLTHYMINARKEKRRQSLQNKLEKEAMKDHPLAFIESKTLFR